MCSISRNILSEQMCFSFIKRQSQARLTGYQWSACRHTKEDTCIHRCVHIHGHALWVHGVYMHRGCLSKLDQHGTISFFPCFVLHLHSPCPALSLNHSSLVIRLLPKTHTAAGKAMQLRSFIKIRSMKIGFCLSVAQSTFVCKAHCPEIDTLAGVQQKVATTVWTDCREDRGGKK